MINLPTFRPWTRPDCRDCTFRSGMRSGRPRARRRNIIAKLNGAVVDALADPGVRTRLADLGQEIPPREQQTPRRSRPSRRPRSRNGGRSSRRRTSRGNESARRQHFRKETMMKLPRRQFLHLAAGAAALPAVSRIARAQAYPSRPVRIVVGFAAGGATDIVARLIGQWLSERLGQPFVIENRPGAGSNIGTEAVVRAPAGRLYAPPGRLTRTRSMRRSTTSSISISSATSRRSRASSACPMSWWCNPSVPAKTVPEFIAYAKANPGKINMASAGNGTAHPCGRRAVQDDDRRRHGARALSRRRRRR